VARAAIRVFIMALSLQFRTNQVSDPFLSV
jgi:hypothetical protein